MLDFGVYTNYITAAYGLSLLGIGFLICMSLGQNYKLKRQYDQLCLQDLDINDAL